MKKQLKPDVLHFRWTCPLCHWSGELSLETHFGNDRARHLRLGDCLFDCHKKVEPRHVYFLEKFACPGCVDEENSFFFLAEIHCIGNRWVAVQTFPAHELIAAEPRL
ncbi:MAG: hypothetical protein HYY26_06685 [Acidobacteria bacterium]|nr:hypothetical protein [Acidobacteriota bacterium]